MMEKTERDDYLEQREEYLIKTLEPTDDEEMAKMLSMVAIVKGIDGPSDEAIKIYYRLLMNYPKDILWQAVKDLLSTHVYKSFPQPAEFITLVDRRLIAERRIELKEIEGWMGKSEKTVYAKKWPKSIGSILKESGK